jgi:hypothetical protein
MSVDPSYIEKFFDDLEGMNVDLDDDPLEYGPRRIIQKIAETRAYLTRCEQYSLQISRALQLSKKEHRASQLDFDLQMQHLLANDPEVRAGRNVADRNAIATVKLNDLKEKISGAEVLIQDLDLMMTSLKSKRVDLKDIQNRLKDQMRLCQEEIGLGGKWGSRTPNPNAPQLSSAPLIDLTTLKELDAMFPKDAEVQIPEESVVEAAVITTATSDKPEFPSPPQGEGEDAEFDSFLSEIPNAAETKSKKNEISIDDLLGDL